jgi:hypothetical protein
MASFRVRAPLPCGAVSSFVSRFVSPGPGSTPPRSGVAGHPTLRAEARWRGQWSRANPERLYRFSDVLFVRWGLLAASSYTRTGGLAT